jgi:hypothetical protein
MNAIQRIKQPVKRLGGKGQSLRGLDNPRMRSSRRSADINSVPRFNLAHSDTQRSIALVDPQTRPIGDFSCEQLFCQRIL